MHLRESDDSEDSAMKKRSKIAAGAGAALAVVGTGAAVAADRLTPKAESQAIVNDAAKQLGVDPAKLSDALEQALKNRIDAAVNEGRLTEAQGEAMKRRISAADFPLFIGPGFDRQRGPLRGLGHHWVRGLDAAAAYLSLTESELRAALESGKSLAQIAKDENKSVDGLVDALVKETTTRLDQAVTDGRLTKADRDKIVAGLKEQTEAIVNGTAPPDGFRFRGHRGDHGFFFPGPRRDG
jgi:CRISPR/Cas system-associated endoribonuclease Cas2